LELLVFESGGEDKLKGKETEEDGEERESRETEEGAMGPADGAGRGRNAREKGKNLPTCAGPSS